MNEKDFKEMLVNWLRASELDKVYFASNKPHVDGDITIRDGRIIIDDKPTPYMLEDVEELTYRPAEAGNTWVRIKMKSGEEIILTKRGIEGKIRRRGEIITCNKPGIIKQYYKEIVEAQESGVSNDDYVIVGKCLRDYNSNSKIIEIPEGVETMSEYLFQKSGIQKVIFPSTMKAIPTCAFDESLQLVQASFNPGLEEIGEYAFNQTALRIIKLPASLKSIHDHGFSYSDITKIEGMSSNTWVSSTAFEGTPYEARKKNND